MTGAYDETVRAQRSAARPEVSAFVAANAGAGKTRVLTNRVARLLLAGAAPDRILCITFTKAAAAEMASRLYKMLGEWALSADDALDAALNELDGAGARARGETELSIARRLFARALETPGGLKIQTIHSFCENVLKRFPIEAGIAPGFTVIEDVEAHELAGEAVDAVAATAEGSVHDALARLAGAIAPGTLRDLIISNTMSRHDLSRAREASGGWDKLVVEIARGLGLRPGDTQTSLLAEGNALVSDNDLRGIQTIYRKGLVKTGSYAKGPIADALAASSPGERFAAMRSWLLKADGDIKQSYDDKNTKHVDPGLGARVAAIAEQYRTVADRLNAVTALDDTRALHVILRETIARYDDAKAARAALDYDDLIDRTRSLFSDRGGAQWVLYKLDQGLDHILLDEAQDTSPAQWAVIEGPLPEFFAGEGARPASRTFFAVGDQKQSIYSFQGADASLFQEKRIDLEKRIGSAAPFVDEPLRLSFRTTEPVLTFVDALFSEQQALEGLSDEALAHAVYRDGPGSVELWPLTPRISFCSAFSKISSPVRPCFS